MTRSEPDSNPTHEEQLKELYLKQKHILDLFLERGAISRAQELSEFYMCYLRLSSRAKSRDPMGFLHSLRSVEMTYCFHAIPQYDKSLRDMTKKMGIKE